MLIFKHEWTEADWENLKLSDDFLFGYVMQDTNLAKLFLESLLGIEIDSVENVKTQDVIELAPNLRGVRLDVRLKADGRLVSIEMQTSNNCDLPRRIRYYQAMGDSQLLLRSAFYESLSEYLTIFVCTFDPFKDAGLPVYTVKYVVEEKPSLPYDDGRKIILFNTTAWQKSLDKNQKDMLKYIQQGGEQFESEKVSDFAGGVTNIKTENQFRRNYMNLSLKIMETRKEGFDEGFEQGIEQGIARAREQHEADQEQIAQQTAEIDRLKARLAEYEHLQ